MTSTGLIRRVDALGRVVLPARIRQNLGLESGSEVEIFTEGDQIVLRKFQSACIFCDSTQELVAFRGKVICRACAEQMTHIPK